MKVEFYLGLNLVGCEKREVVELDDDLTDEEIDEEWEYWRDQKLEGGWNKK